MSFKREGDDYGGLVILKKRRVAELFANDIPVGEALLCSNGRFSCSVCKHKPVFDTINMLAVHRKGKKHLANAAMATAEKEELAELVLKRQQQMYLGGSGIDLNMVNSTTSFDGILTSPVYDPRMRRPKVKPHDRKPRVDLGSIQQCSQTQGENSVSLSSNPNPRFKNFKKDFLRQQQQDEKGVSVSTLPRSGNHEIPVPGAWSQTACSADEESSAKQVPEASSVESKQTLPAERTYVHQKYYKKKHYICDRVGKTNVSNEEREKQEKYLQLRGAGWKKDWCGKWVKEEGVEFDSDEEPPDVA
ncbi:sodium channel modifier 1-like [Lineus longissimus]|uniref:sodium channel modifier 1-like n=1 Tax=Lineus longissimus TaxID=88925 RepID=UPI002B4E7B2B